MDRDEEHSSYRRSLRSAVGSSAAPYGYTLAIWTTGSVVTHARGTPDTVDALVFMAGAVLAFALLSLLAFGGVRTGSLPGQNPPTTWGSFHFVYVGLAIAIATLVAHTVQSFMAWPLASFASTVIYLLVLAVEVTLANWRSPARLRTDNGPRAG